VLPFTPKVFTSIAAGVGFAALAAVVAHFEPHLLSFIPAPEQPAATALVSTAVSGTLAWFKKESADETPAEKAVSTVVASAVVDALPTMADKSNPAPSAS
jgi:hypothetical protein